MNVLGLISSKQDPASRARIIQYKEPLASYNVDLNTRFYTPYRDADPAPWTYNLKRITGISEWRISNSFKLIARLPLLLKQFQYDLIWQNRLLLPYHFFFEKKFNRPFVFDYDDAIWINEGEKQVAAAISKADLVFAGNEYLAQFGSRFNKNILIIPTTVDTHRLYPLGKKPDVFTIGWIGSKSNLPFLEIIKTAVLDFLRQNKDSRLVIISSEPPVGFPFDNERIFFKPWDPSKENDFINEFSIGLMPLPENDYTKGKCGYKLLQYMACGKPIIASPVGMNSNLLASATIGLPATSTEDWMLGFTKLKKDTAFYEACALNGPQFVKENYSVEKYAPLISAHFRKLSSQD